jgi:hypothetical protein
MCLNMLEKVTTRHEDEPDFMFLKSPFSSINKLGPLKNLDFTGEVIQLLRHKLTSASPVQFSSNSSSVQSRYDQYFRPSSSRQISHYLKYANFKIISLETWLCTSFLNKTSKKVNVLTLFLSDHSCVI